MSEAKWLTDATTNRKLGFLGGKAGARKFCLFALACCRRVWRFLPDASRRAVEVGERCVEGAASREEREAAYEAATKARADAEAEAVQAQAARAAEEGSVPDPTDAVTPRGCAALAAAAAIQAAKHYLNESEARTGGPANPASNVTYLAFHAAGTAVDNGREAVMYEAQEQAAAAGADYTDEADEAVCNEEDRRQGILLHDVFGNPFRPAPLDPSWLAWKGGVIRKLAQAIYDDRAFARLPVLADALEDAGCTDAAILGHCRGPGEHVRGCWVVDLLLGKS
jgi:hypothetical protein